MKGIDLVTLKQCNNSVTPRVNTILVEFIYSVLNTFPIECELIELTNEGLTRISKWIVAKK